jgi:hypothetical protein
MARSANVFVAVCMSLVVFISTAVAGDGDDPKIKGKPLSKLIKQLTGSNRGLQVRAARAISEATPEQIPKVVPKLIPILKSDRENDRFVAAQTLGNYGPPAREAVPLLVPLLKGTQHERNRAAAAKALGLILEDAKPSEEIDKVAAALTAKFNEDYDQYEDVRRESVRALGMIGPAAKSCIPKLTRALKDHGDHLPDLRGVRKEAAWTCGRMGPLAKEHMDLLISMMHQEGEWIPEIVEAIGRIGPVHENVVPNIIDKMEKTGKGHADGWSSKKKAYEALEGFGEKALPAKDYLIRVLRETPNNRVPLEPLIASCRALAAMGPKAKDALPMLEKMKTYISHPHAQIPKEKHDLLHKEAEAAIKAVSAK